MYRHLDGSEALERGHTYLHPFAKRARQSSDGQRTTVNINTDDLDAHGTVIEPEGVVLDRYRDNPIVLLEHRYPAANDAVVSLRETEDGAVLQATVEEDNWDLEDERVMNYFRKIKEGIIRMASIGFEPLEWREEETEDDGRFVRITRWLLVEWSFVKIGSNPKALVTQRNMELSGERETSIYLRETLEDLTEKVDQLDNHLRTLSEGSASDEPPEARTDSNEAAAPAPNAPEDEAEARSEDGDASAEASDADDPGSDDERASDEEDSASEKAADDPAGEDESPTRAEAEQPLIAVSRSELASMITEARRERAQHARKLAKQQAGRL